MIELEHNFMMFWVFILAMLNSAMLCVTLAYLVYFAKRKQRRKKPKPKEEKAKEPLEDIEKEKHVVKERVIRRTPEYEE